MAKLSDRQKENIKKLLLARRHDKELANKNTNIAIAKKYKVDEKTIRNIEKTIPQENHKIVEVGVAIENLKKSDKSPKETKCINDAINIVTNVQNEREKIEGKIYKSASDIMDKINQMLNNGKVDDKINIGDGVQQFEPRNIIPKDLQEMAKTMQTVANTTQITQKSDNNQNENNNEKRVTIARRSDRTE